MLDFTLPDLAHTLWLQLILVLLFGFLTGLEMREYRQNFGQDEPQFYLGTIRTYTLIALIGWLLNLLSPWSFYMGLGALTVLYTLMYHRQLKLNQTSIIPFLIVLLVYHYGPLLQAFPLWLLTAIFVAIVFLLHMREQIAQMSEALAPQEIFTLAKLLLLSAVILPLLPQDSVADWLPVSPFKIWLAAVVVSTISYLGYVAQRYFFPHNGILITALFGGIYSSTVTTVVLAKQSGTHPQAAIRWSAGILLATTMMYVRLWAIAAIFRMDIARLLLPSMLFLALLSLLMTLLLWLRPYHDGRPEIPFDSHQHNPLELKTALTFALLFAFMAVLTDQVSHTFGNAGLTVLSLIVGFTDIDPFVLALLTGQFRADTPQLASAILLAAGANNLLKALYALWFGERQTGRLSALGLTTLGALTILAGLCQCFM